MPIHEKILTTMFVVSVLTTGIGWIVYKCMGDDEAVMDVVGCIDLVLLGAPVLYTVGKGIYWVFKTIWS